MCTCVSFLSRSAGARPAGPFDVAGVMRSLGLSGGTAPPRHDLALEPVTVINPGEERIEEARVVVRDGRIHSVEKASPNTNGARRFVLPGLVDLHTHAFPGTMDWFGRLELMHGVTSVRNTGADVSIFGYKAAVARGERVAPRIFAGGMPLDGRPAAFPPPFSGTVLETPESGRRVVQSLAARGADHVKTFINLTPPVLSAVCSEAAELGIPVIGHVPRFSEIGTAGVADVQHLAGVPAVPTTAFAVDGSFPAWLEAWSDVPGDRLARVTEACLEKGIAHTATLVLWKGLARCADPTLERPDTVGLMPDAFTQVVWNTGRPPGPYVKACDERMLDGVLAAWPHMLECVAAFREAGVTVLPGTDVVNPWIVPGRGLHEELELLVSCGYTPEETLRLATREAGARLGVEGLGTIAAGAPADLLVLRDDPTRDLRALATLERVVADGRDYAVEALRDEQAAFCERFSGVLPRLLARLGGAALTALYSALPASEPRYDASM